MFSVNRDIKLLAKGTIILCHCAYCAVPCFYRYGLGTDVEDDTVSGIILVHLVVSDSVFV